MFELDPNHPFDIGDPACQRVFAITALVYALIIGLIFLASTTGAHAETADVVAIMNAMGFTYCFVALCLLIGICIVTAIVQRTMRHNTMVAHQEKMEAQRLANTKEITPHQHGVPRV